MLVSGEWLVAVLCWVAAPGLMAGSPQHVQFDIRYTVGCPDVTPPEFVARNPDERLVQARFEVSSLIASDSEDDLIQYFYRMECPERIAQIVDYSPRTTLAAGVAGNIGVEHKKEASQSLGLSVSGTLEHCLRVNGAGDRSEKNTRTEKYEQLPPLELLASSGTTQRGYGVYFKLRPSPRGSLEGAKEFTLVLRVPRDWRGDYVVIRCEAQGLKRGVVRTLDERTVWGARDFVVALYAEGDEEAKATAARYVEAEARLRRSLQSTPQRGQPTNWTTVVREVGDLLTDVGRDLAMPVAPRSRTEGIAQRTELSREQPAETRLAARAYADAKAALHGWRRSKM